MNLLPRIALAVTGTLCSAACAAHASSPVVLVVIGGELAGTRVVLDDFQLHWIVR
jgi:hypothetical protein